MKDATNFEPVTTAEAIGRAAGMLTAFVAVRVAQGKPPTPDDFEAFAENIVYDEEAIRPEIKQFFQGLLEGISVSLDGAADDTL